MTRPTPAAPRPAGEAALTHVVVELEGPGDLHKMAPLANLGVGEQVDGGSKDLTADLAAAQLTALPDRTPPGG